MVTILGVGAIEVGGPYDQVLVSLDAATGRFADRRDTWLAEKTLDDVVGEVWPVADGWTVRAAEVVWFYVLYLAEHPEHGLGVSLLSVQPRVARIGDVDKSLDEMWQVLDVDRRAEHVADVVHAYGSNRVEVLTQFLNLTHITRAERRRVTALFALLVESPFFMNDALRTLLALNPAYDRRIGQAREHWRKQSALLGSRPSTFLLGAGA